MKVVNEAVRGNVKLPAVPRVVTQLLLLLKKPSVSTHELATAVEQDPMIAARTLQLANSPYYGGGRSMGTINDAMSVLGTEGVQRMVLTVGLASVFTEVPGVNLRQFWVDAAVAATSARALARLASPTQAHSEVAYLAGLLHGAGHLILCASNPEAAKAAFSLQRRPRGVALTQVEQFAFGYVHPSIGAEWMAKLGMPEVAVHAVAHHLQPLLPGSGLLAPTLGLATLMAEGVDAGDSVQELSDKADDALLEAAGVSRQAFDQLLQSSLDALRRMPAPG